MEDRPFQILEKINDNTYIVDLSSEYGVNVIFNVSDLPGELTKFHGIFNTFYLHLDYKQLGQGWLFIILAAQYMLLFCHA